VGGPGNAAPAAELNVRLIELEIRIAAPIERVFDLARSIDLHVDSTAGTGERAIAGVTSGLIGLGESVTWRARHFLVWQTLTSRITAFDRPHTFQDSMVQGAFTSFVHDHRFTTQHGVTVMVDRLAYRAPLGPLGAVVSRLVLDRHLRRLLAERNRVIARTAESEAWRRYLPR